MKHINNEDDFTSFGKSLNHFMLKSGMTAEKLAEKLRCTPETVSKYRNDHNIPSFYDVLEIARILGLNPFETKGMLEFANYSIDAPIESNRQTYEYVCQTYYRHTQKCSDKK